VVIREALIHEGETPLLLLLPSLNDSREEWERWVGPCEIYKWKKVDPCTLVFAWPFEYFA